MVSRLDSESIAREGGTYYLNVSGGANHDAADAAKSNDSYGVTVKADFGTRHGIELLGKLSLRRGAG